MTMWHLPPAFPALAPGAVTLPSLWLLPGDDLGRERLQRAKIALGRGARIGAALRCRQAERDQRLGLLYRGADTVDHRDLELAAQLPGKIRHAGTAEHDGFGALLGDGSGDLIPQLLNRAGGR